MNPIVLAWVLIAAAGVLLSIWSAREWTLDLLALDHRANGRRIHARAGLRREVIRFIVHAAYLGIGLPLLDRPVNVSLTVVVLLLGNVGLIVNSILDLRTRYVLLETRGKEPPIRD